MILLKVRSVHAASQSEIERTARRAGAGLHSARGR